MPPRYFIGLSLPEDISKQISVVQYKLYDEKLLLKPLIPHITIIHPGALQTISPLWLIPKIKAFQNQYMPFEIKILSFGLFHKSNLHLKVKCPEMVNMYDQMIKLLPEDVIKTQFIGKRPFEPHITIAQSKPKSILDEPHLKKYRDGLNPIIGINFSVNNITKFDHTAPRQYKIKEINSAKL